MRFSGLSLGETARFLSTRKCFEIVTFRITFLQMLHSQHFGPTMFHFHKSKKLFLVAGFTGAIFKPAYQLSLIVIQLFGEAVHIAAGHFFGDGVVFL